MSGNGQGHALPPRPDVLLAEDPDGDQEVKPLTRKRVAPWDRLKILILLLGAFIVLVWSTIAQFAGLISLGDAFMRPSGAVVAAGPDRPRGSPPDPLPRLRALRRATTSSGSAVFGGFDRRAGR